jgi:L-fucose isomerase-like protein
MVKKQKFALFFGNRSVFSPSMIGAARRQLPQAVAKAGFDYVMADEDMTPFGAVETIGQAEKYAQWLKSQSGVDGVILSMPNFSDENGAATALRDAGVPILIQAYPDELDKFDAASRRDAFCGKLSIIDVFNQYKIPFTIFPPHCVHPLTAEFENNLKDFAAVCRVVNGMKRFTVGAFGARTTRFKTVRFDEIALQQKGITVETIDLSEVFAKIDALSGNDGSVIEKIKTLKGYVNCSGINEESLIKLSKLAVVIDKYIEEYRLNAVAFRCWPELGDKYGLSVCPVMSELNNRGIPASCEVDVCTAVAMYALCLASDTPSMCLDWNNNYGSENDKCIVFHCGPVPKALMKEGGKLTPNELNNNTVGCYVGNIAPNDITYACCKTENGKITFCFGEGEITDDPIDNKFFGAKGVARILGLQQKLIIMGRIGFRHHVAMGKGHFENVLREAFTYYLGYDIIELKR